MSPGGTPWLLSGLLVLGALQTPGKLLGEPPDGSRHRAGGDAGAPRLLYQLAGHTYARRSFDRKGKLVGHQRIEVGELVDRHGSLVLPVHLVVFDVERGTPEAPVVEKRIDMELQHAASESGLAMNVLAFLGRKSKELRIRVVERGRIYPDTPREGMRLPELVFDIRLEKGALSFLGARTHVRMRNRIVRTRGVYETLPDAYEIHSDVEAKFFLIGIRWRKKLFHSTQLLAPGHGLLREALIAQGGARQIFQATDVEPGGDE